MVRSPRPGRARARASLALIGALLAVSLSGCGALGPLGAELAKYAPKVSFKKLKLRSIDWKKLGVDFVFTLDNPHPVGLALDRFSWGLDLKGKALAKGTQDKGLKLKPKSKSPLVLPVDLTFTQIYDTLTSLSGKDEVPYTLKGSMGFDTPLGPVDVPVKKKGTLPLLHKPTISLKAARVTSLDILKGKAGFEVDLGIANPKGGSTLAFTDLDYGVKLGGKKVASGLVKKAKEVPASGSRTLTLPVKLNLGALGQSLIDALTKKKSVEVGFDAKVDVGTTIGKVPLSVSRKKVLKLK